MLPATSASTPGQRCPVPGSLATAATPTRAQHGSQYGTNVKHSPVAKPTSAVGQYGVCRACLVTLKKDNSSKRQRGLNRAKRRCTACVPTTAYCALCDLFRAHGDFDGTMCVGSEWGVRFVG